MTTEAVARPRLAVVIPCYNEEEVLPETMKRMTELLDRMVGRGKISSESLIYFVDDGSRDRTWEIIRSQAGAKPYIAGLKLSRNRGHQNALLAGLFYAKGDVIVSIDADLQDDINVIESMVDEFNGGVDVVYGVRKRRETDSFFKRNTAEGFYRLIAWMGAETVFNHADFRLLSRRAIEALKQYGETNLFLRGIVPLIGYRSSTVEYDRAERFAGESKYPLRKMIALALEAITSFSVVPLRFITLIGFTVSAGSVALSAWILWVRLFTDHAVPGWTSTTLPIYLLGGIQILCLGVMGEYLGKIYVETKRRPRFLVDIVLDDSSAYSGSARTHG